MRTALVVGALCLFAVTANAQVTMIGPFTGSDQEGFETQSGTALPCVPNPPRIFNSQGDLCTPGGNGVYLTSGWSYLCQLKPHSGTRMCGTGGSVGGGGINITFDKPVSRFGGYFGMNHTGLPDFTVTMYAGTKLVYGPTAIKHPCDCLWYWYGWDMGGTGVDLIHLDSNHSSTGYLHMDDLELDFGPLCLVSYGSGCAGGGGFVPKLTAPACAVAGSNFTINIADGLGGATTFLLLGTNQAAIPMVFGCSLNVTPVFPVVLSFPLGGSGFGAGTVSLSGPIPTSATGLSFTSQVFVADPNVYAGYSNSMGLQVKIQ